MSKIIICWNNDAFGRELCTKAKDDSLNYSVCLSKKEWESHKIRKDVGNAKILIVLCELSWDHTTSLAPLTEFRGIRLVQYLRANMGLKFPVVFVSFLSPNQIVALPSLNADILFTPALQHEFLQLSFSENPTKLLSSFFYYGEKMRRQSDKDLAYTRMFYCDVDGLIKRIRHSINGPNKEKLKQQLESIVKIKFPQKQDELNALLSSNGDLSRYCDALIESKYEVFSVLALNEKAKRILFIEDDIEDANVKRFLEYCKKHYNEYDLKLVLDKKGLSDVWKEGCSNYFVDYDVVICDIELRYDEKLEYMGYDIIDRMTAISKKPVYYIVTNMSRSVYDQIKTDAVKRIMLKNEAWGSEANIEKFLYGVKEVIKDRKANLQQEDKGCDKIFKYFYSFTKKCHHIIDIKYKNVYGEEISMKLSSWEEINQFVSVNALSMFDFFKEKYDNINEDNAFLTFNKCCVVMREKLNGNNLRGGKEWKKMDMTNIPSDKDLIRFVKILILRRFFLCVRKWVQDNHIMKSLDEYRRGKGQMLTINDLSFRAIGNQYKTLNKVGENRFEKIGTENPSRPQTRFDATLLWASKSIQLSDEEKEFERGLS